MAEAKKVTLKLGKESLEVAKPTYAGIAALESLGWKVVSGDRPRPKPNPTTEPK